MKKIIFFSIFLVLSQNIFSQQEQLTKHELKFNAAYLLGGIPEFGYNFILNEESTIGIDVLFSIDDDIEPFFALTPNYRFFFGKKRAAGFFAETFAMLNTTESVQVDAYSQIPGTSIGRNDDNKETDLALGVSIGGKFLTKKGFLFEIYAGVGRNLFNEQSVEMIPRLGVSFGKRF